MSKSGHGGARPGSGPKPKNYVRRNVSISLPLEEWEILEKEAQLLTDRSDKKITHSTLINENTKKLVQEIKQKPKSTN